MSLIDMLVDKFIESDDLIETTKLLKNGMDKEYVHASISSVGDYGYLDLYKKLSSDKNIPLLIEKLELFLSGRDSDDNPIWNNGNIVRDMSGFTEILDEYKNNEYVFRIKDRIKKSMHIYRGMENRHGHSNDKPSYWAFGYDTTKESHVRSNIGMFINEMPERNKKRNKKKALPVEDDDV